MPFAHLCGHRPLPGYVIKRGISKGGFGEVYFGLSDGGKEVALKRLIRDQDVELRGIRQCLNLKHPHLVHLYDLKTDDRGDHWLVMEYVRGETLHSLLQKHPSGLSHDLIRPWFEQLAAAVHSLHEQGIVHRDLKPANVFLENGLVKVGDYGLCKFIGGSQHRAQTQNVGTVYYMAPEVGKGDYSRTIDVYAAGIVLYEMVTGRVPFDGETTAEILFKHLSSPPDLSKAGPFAPIIAIALAKDPKQRYASLSEMAKRVSETDPQLGKSLGMPVLSPKPVPKTNNEPIVLPLATPTKTETSMPSRLALAGLLSAAIAYGWGEIFGDGRWPRMAPVFVLAAVGSASILGMSYFWKPTRGDWLSRRAVQGLLGVGLGLLAVWLQGYSLLWLDGPIDAHLPRNAPAGRFAWLFPQNHSGSVLFAHVAYFGVMLAMLRWWRLTTPQRPTRFSWYAMFATMFWAYVMSFLLPSTEERQIGFATIVIVAAVVQIASPRREPDPLPSKRLRLNWA